MKKLTFLILSLLMSSFISKAGSGSCTLYSSADGSAECTSTDYYNAMDTWYVTNSGSAISLHGWGTVNSWADNGYVILEAVWGDLYSSVVTGQHWDISYDSAFSDAQSYGSRVDLYSNRFDMDGEGELYLCSRTSDGADGGIFVSW